jgi:glycosyltransferase involved in cell wall biosynthesis
MKVALLTTDNREHDRNHAAPQPYFGTAPQALLQGFTLLPELEVHVVSCLQKPAPAPEKIAPNIFYHGLVVPKSGWMRTFYQGCIRATRKKLREIQPDIVHGQGSERDCAIAAAYSGFPNVVTIHGNMKAIAEIYGRSFGNFYWLAAKLETLALKKTAGVLCNSAYTESLVAPRAKKTWRVPNALRTDFFSPAPVKLANSKPVILNIGVVEARKQQIALLAVARRLHECGLKFELQFIGKQTAGNYYSDVFTQQIADAERAGYARKLGVLSTSQITARMDAADALLHFPTEEAFGLVTAEALARGLKYFGSAVGGSVEITEGVPGAELFPAHDFGALEIAIARWLKQGYFPTTNATQIMRARYHPEIIVRQHLEIYKDILYKNEYPKPTY